MKYYLMQIEIEWPESKKEMSQAFAEKMSKKRDEAEEWEGGIITSVSVAVESDDEEENKIPWNPCEVCGATLHPTNAHEFFEMIKKQKQSTAANDKSTNE